MTVVLKNSAVIYKPLRYFLGSWLRQTSKGACLFECNWVGSWQEAGETLWAGRGTVTGVGHFSTHSGYAKAQGRCCSASPASRVLLNTQQLVLMRRDWGSPFSCAQHKNKTVAAFSLLMYFPPLGLIFLVVPLPLSYIFWYLGRG